jgi:hypothetical protein
MRQAMPQNNHNVRAGQKCFLTADEHGFAAKERKRRKELNRR